MMPERFHGAGLRWMAYRTAGSFEQLRKMWLSMLLVPGTLVKNKKLGVLAVLVLASGPYYAVVWHVSPIASGGQYLVSFLPPEALQQSPFMLLQVSDIGPGWTVLKMKGVSPRAAEGMLGTSAAFQLCFQNVQKPTILEAAARNCFRGLSVAWLTRLHKYLGVGGGAPTTELDLCRCLLKFSLPDCADEEQSF